MNLSSAKTQTETAWVRPAFPHSHSPVSSTFLTTNTTCFQPTTTSLRVSRRRPLFQPLLANAELNSGSAQAQPPQTTVELAPAPTKKEIEKQKTLDFVRWIEQNGVHVSDKSGWGVAPHPLVVSNETTDDGEPSGRGLLASKGIIQNECLFEIPFKLCIDKHKAVEYFNAELKLFPQSKSDNQKSKSKSRLLQSTEEEINEYMAIALFLIKQRSLGPKSFYHPYIQILPEDDEDLNCLFRYSEEDLALLKGSPTIAAAQSLKMKLKAEYDDVKQRYFEKHPQFFPPQVFTYDAWQWAFAILFSRAVMLTADKVIALVPYADLLNHSPFCNTYIDSFTRFMSKDKYVRAYTDRLYNRFDQVYITYGQKSNAELLLLYGFVVDRNPYDSVDLTVALSQQDPLYQSKKEYLESIGKPLELQFPLFPDRYPMELIQFLRFCAARNQSELDADFTHMVSDENETAVAEALIQACTEALNEYPQTLDEDNALIKDRKLFKMFSTRQRMAIKLRRGEKRILKRTIANIEKEIVNPEYLFVKQDR